MSRAAEKPRAAIPTTWVDAGSVRVQRAEGQQPLFLQMHIGDGELGGRSFSLGVNVGGGDIIIHFDEHKGDGDRTYIVRTRDVLTMLGETDDGLVRKGGKQSELTLFQTLALAMAKLDVDAAKWTELDSSDVSQVTDEHLGAVLAHADALRASAASAVACVRNLQADRARKAGG